MTSVIFIEDRILMLDMMKTAIDWNSQEIKPIGFYACCEDALPRIMEQPPDVVVTDIVMHGMDGLELSKMLHESDLDVKIIIISAYSRFDYAQRALQAGVFDYFEKPLDFHALADSIVRAGKENNNTRQIRSFLLNHRAIYRERCLTKLMLSQMDDTTDIEGEATFLELDSVGGMICAVCRLLPMKVNCAGVKAMNREIMYLMLSKSLSEHYGESNLFGPYSLHGDEATFLLMHQAYDDSNAMMESFTELAETFTETMQVKLHAGIGEWTNHLQCLNSSYEAARRALDACCQFDEDCCIIHVRDLIKESNVQWILLNRLETQLIHAISSQDTVALQKAIDCSRKEMKMIALSSETLRVVMKSILFKAKSMSEKTDGKEEALIASIDCADTLEKMLDIVYKYCAEVCSSLRISQNKQCEQLAQKAQQYIDEHFDSSQFSLNDVARYVSLSPNYLCSLYKRVFQVGVHEYMTQKRIDLAKNMLIHSDTPIGSIGQQTGYSNPYHFSMSFKKYTNMAPTEYRKKNRI